MASFDHQRISGCTANKRNFRSEVILYGEYSSPEEMGNIMYAYLGRCIGFSETVLYWGGDYAAGGWNGIKNSADTPEDKAAIQKGFNLYNKKKG